MINCVIIDDEQHSIDLIRSFCEKIPYLNVSAEFSEPLAASSFLDSNPIDLIFLDINMPTISGIDFIKLYKLSNVILITAYSEYALDSYEYGVIDYLLKPISFDRFLNATQKALNLKRKTITQNLKSNETSFFYVKTDRGKFVKLNFTDIKYIEGLKNYILICTTNDKIITLLNMKSMEEKLPQRSFIRVHKSYIINWDFFDSIEGNMIRIANVDQTIPLGSTYKPSFLETLDKNLIR